MTIEDFLSSPCGYTEAINSLLPTCRHRNNNRQAYVPDGIYGFWDSDKWSLDKEKRVISVSRSNFNHEWEGGKNFYKSLIEKSNENLPAFCVYRKLNKKTRKAFPNTAKVLSQNGIPLRGMVTVKFKPNSLKTYENLSKVTIKFPLYPTEEVKDDEVIKSTAQRETRRSKARNVVTQEDENPWLHGILMNRLSEQLRKNNIPHETEYSFQNARRADVVSRNSDDTIDIYEIKTHWSRAGCEQQSIVQLLDYLELARRNSLTVRNLITVGMSGDGQEWVGREFLKKEINHKWSYQHIALLPVG